MDAAQFLHRLMNSEAFRGQVVHTEVIPERPAVYGEIADGLHPIIEQLLSEQGISQLYSHQAAAIDTVRDGDSVVVVTGTASGKTLCYNIPIVETLLLDPRATALCIYPTKALAQDQLRSIGSFRRPEFGLDFLAGTYDGDTPGDLRRRLRDGGHVILTNPDMLHQGILPHHARWNCFFTHLKYVVIDEVHAYRGVFGSHLANVLRRLRRVCSHYDTSPQFICSSATIGNPRDHAEAIIGTGAKLVDRDGSSRGAKRFVLWNPPPLDSAARDTPEHWRFGGDRRSPVGECVQLLSGLVQEGIQSIAFVRSRLTAELILKSIRENLQPISPRLARSVQAYRGGYLPEERREIERGLSSGEILAVASTNALELGIDIGSLDACVLVGYPGTIASLWQQAGRAGRGAEESLVFLVAQNTPMDQYLMAHSDYLFAQSVEQAVIDPNNPHVTIGHLKCALHELPLTDDEAELFGPYAPALLDLLEEEQSVRRLRGAWYWASSEYPAAGVSLRNISGAVYTIQDETNGARVIGTLDEMSALAQLHDHAVYMHGAETYFVEQLDLEEKIARVQRRDLDYYTQSIQMSQVRIDETEEELLWRGGLVGFGDVTVTTSIPIFKKVRFHSRDSLGFEALELPPQSLETVAMWFAPPRYLVEQMQRAKTVVGEALIGIANVLVEVAPVFVMCDPQDVGTTVEASCLGRDALFLYDRYPGGMGYAYRCLGAREELMQSVYEVIAECSCQDGCPSCVGSAIPTYAATDLDGATRGRIPDKEGALYLLHEILK